MSKDDDIGSTEYWRDINSVKKEIRAANRENAPVILTANGVSFSVHNGGAHLIVSHGGQTFDFWPGTGKWIGRARPKYTGRGIFKLLGRLGVTQ